MYISSIGHGIVYISTLSYFNFRISSIRRSLKISTLFIRYFVGCSWAAQAIVESVDFRDGNNHIGEPGAINEYVGMILTVMSIISLLLIGINELLQWYHVRDYNYKRSLDENVNNGKYFYSRKKTTELLRARQMLDISTENKTLRFCNILKRGSVFWILLLKLSGTMLFSNMMIVFTGMASTLYHDEDPYYYYFVQWTVLIGAVVGMFTLIFLSGKSIFQISAIGRIALLITALALYSSRDQFSEIAVPMTVYFAFCGLSYFVADMAIMDMTNPKWLEIMLAIGYIIEMVPIAVLQSFHYYRLEEVVSNTDLNTFAAYASTFIIATVILMVIAAVFLLNTHGKSLLQLRYEMWGIADCTPVSTPTPVVHIRETQLQRDNRQIRPSAPDAEMYS